MNNQLPLPASYQAAELPAIPPKEYKLRDLPACRRLRKSSPRLTDRDKLYDYLDTLPSIESLEDVARGALLLILAATISARNFSSVSEICSSKVVDRLKPLCLDFAQDGVRLTDEKTLTVIDFKHQQAEPWTMKSRLVTNLGQTTFVVFEVSWVAVASRWRVGDFNLHWSKVGEGSDV